MKQRLALFGLLGLFWMVFFTISRIFFLLYHYPLAADLSLFEILKIMVLGSRMDAAIAGDCLLLPGLLLTASCISNGRWVAIANHVIVVAFLLIASVVVVADLELYRHWGFRMDSTPLLYIGSEGAGSVGIGVVVTLIILLLILAMPAGWVYFKKIAPRFRTLPPTRWYLAIVMFIATGLLFIPIRSSFSVAPLNTGVVYFHRTNPFANHAGINVVWNFFESVADDDTKMYPENFADEARSKDILAEMNQGSDSTLHLVGNTKPNIILIILESFTARVIEPLGGLPDVTPHINELVHDGVLFDSIYASGDRTDKGIVAILSGYSAQPKTSIIKYPSKTQSLPFITKSLAQLGYHNSFIYGGDIGFANMESYVTTAGFGHVTEDDDFPSEVNISKWGVHDHYVFERLWQECDTATTPFFKVMLSLSSHEPFDVPLDPPFRPGNKEVDQFVNAIHYTDQSLGAFIAKAKESSWWKNTLIVITADHGHRFPDAEELKDKGRFRIPLIWTGGAITKKDTVIHTTGSQLDIVNTLLSQVSKTDPHFEFSKNLLDPLVTPYAVYVFHNGYGYVDGQAEHVYDFDLKDYVNKKGDREERAKAFMQVLFSDYNRR